MSWEKVIKAREFEKFTDLIDSDFTALSWWGSFFYDIGGIDNTMSQVWRFVEKPYNWQPEYKLANALMDALEENASEWKHGDIDYTDLGSLGEYMHENGLYLFQPDKIKAHIEELKGKKQ